jgi:hypothetical protein
MDANAIKKYAKQFITLRDEVGVLTTRQTELKTRIMKELDNAEADMNGHRVYEFTDENFGDIKLTKQRRVSKSLNMDVAEDILTRKGIKDTCIKMVPVLDEGAIMSAFYEGYLTEEEIDAMFPAKESYAFLVNK